MAFTVNNPLFPNIANTNLWLPIWTLTRCMKKAGWKYKGSSDGSAKEVTGDPKLDKWGAGVITNVGDVAAVIAAPVNGRAVVTGLTGIVAGDKGRFLTIVGSSVAANNNYHQIEEIISATSVKIDARTFAVDADATGRTWTIVDPLSDVFPSAMNTTYGWWCAQGPSTLKIMITAAPTVGGTGSDFIRGENIKMVSVGFEGELLSYVWDGASSGYLVVNPRVRGSGAGPWGLPAATDTIAGDWSGASVPTTNTGTVEYVQQIVFQKTNSATNGSYYVGSFELSTAPDVTESFTAILTASPLALTATVPPGGGGASNGFPTHAYCPRGIYNTQAGTYWMSQASYFSQGKGLGIAIDCIPEQNYSADGSFILSVANVYSASMGSEGYSFQRVDNYENGDLDPFVTYTDTQKTLYSATRLDPGTAVGGYNGNLFDTQCFAFSSTTYTCLRGWRRRGLTGEAFQDYEPGTLHLGATGYRMWLVYGLLPERTSSAAVATRTLEPIWALAAAATYKQRKGTLKNLFIVQGGFRYDTFQNKTWIQLGSGLTAYSSTISNYATTACPGWDGTTVQLSY